MPPQEFKHIDFGQYEASDSLHPNAHHSSTLEAFQSQLESECPTAVPSLPSAPSANPSQHTQTACSHGTGIATTGTRQARRSPTLGKHLLHKAEDDAHTQPCAIPVAARNLRRPTGCPSSTAGSNHPIITVKNRALRKRDRWGRGGEAVKELAPRRWRFRRGDETKSTTTSVSSANSSSTVSSLGSWSAPSRHRADASLPPSGKRRGGSDASGGASVKSASTASSWAVPVRLGCTARRVPIDRHTRLLLVLPVAALCAASFAMLGSAHQNIVLDALRRAGADAEGADVKMHRARRWNSASARRKLRVGGDATSASAKHWGERWLKRGDAATSSQQQGSRALFELTPRHLDRYPFTNLADVTDPLGKNYTGFYWQIPRAGSSTMKHILGSCLDKVQASRVAKDYCDVESDTLEICETKFGRFVNADPSDDPGLNRASELGLAQSGLADVVVSSRFLHAAGLFDCDSTTSTSVESATAESGKTTGCKGRAFTVLRHPVERAASMFYYLQGATWERNYNPAYKTMSLKEYAALHTTPHDWMVRWLTGKNNEPELTRDDLEFAKLLLKRKFLILLTEDMFTSMERLVKYMDWEDDVPEGGMKCARGAASKVAAQNRNTGKNDKFEADEWEALAKINALDMELYEYAVKLYEEQRSTVFGHYGAGKGGAVNPEEERTPALMSKFGKTIDKSASTVKTLKAVEKTGIKVDQKDKTIATPSDMAKIAAAFEAKATSMTALAEATSSPLGEDKSKAAPLAGITKASTEVVKSELPVPENMKKLAEKFEKGE